MQFQLTQVVYINICSKRGRWCLFRPIVTCDFLSVPFAR